MASSRRVSLPVSAVLLLTVYCTVLSGANQPPTITVGLPYSGKQGFLPLSEDTPLNSILAIMETKDGDEGAAGEVECATDNPYINILLVYPTTYKVKLVKELDREIVNVVEVSITCSDKGSPPLTSTAKFTIEIADINDNAPAFPKPVVNASIAEGVPNGTFVTRVRARDPDDKANGAVVYSLHSDLDNNTSHFTVDNETGKIFTKMDIDRESVDQYVLTVVAADSGLPTLSSSVQVRINVEDVNDNAPVVLTAELHARENQKPMSLVGTIQAKDSDLGKNSELVFSKTESSESSENVPFMVEPNGDVIAAVSLDREQRSEYVLEVIVKDKGNNPQQTSTATISIFVDDINDNAPVIISDCFFDVDDKREKSYENYLSPNNTSSGLVIIDWYTPQDGRIVHKVEAVDEDSGENGRLFFAIESVTSGDPVNKTLIRDPLYRINNATGEISIRRFARKTDHLTQILNISVSDRGASPLSDFCLLNITIDVDLTELTTPSDDSFKFKRRGSRNGGADVFARKRFIFLRHVALSLFVLLLRHYIKV